MFRGDTSVQIILVDGVDELGEEVVDEIRAISIRQHDSVDVEKTWHLTGAGSALVVNAH